MLKFLFVGICAWLVMSGASQATPKNTANIGVLAYRGSDELRKNWMPLSQYLTEVVPDWSFEIVPMTLSSAKEQIEAGQLDFVVTNPGHFVVLNRSHRMSVLASRSQKKSDGRHSTEFGSAVITYKNSGIQSLSDVAGMSVTAIGVDAFGGFQVAWYEFDRAGVDLFSDTESLKFIGFPMDQVVTEVLAKNTDVGIVRSGLMEELISEGQINPNEFEILNTNVTYGHPDTVSTHLYPEWPFAALAATDPELKRRVALGLLGSETSPVAKALGMHDVWSAPLPYHSVQELTEAFQTRLGKSNPLTMGLFSNAVWVALAVVLSASAALWRRRTRRVAPALVTHGELVEDGGRVSGDEKNSLEAENLTQREREILGLIAKGHSTKEIAIDLGISPKTVEFHRANLLRKFGARTSSQLIAMAPWGKH